MIHPKGIDLLRLDRFFPEADARKLIILTHSTLIFEKINTWHKIYAWLCTRLYATIPTIPYEYRPVSSGHHCGAGSHPDNMKPNITAAQEMHIAENIKARLLRRTWQTPNRVKTVKQKRQIWRGSCWKPKQPVTVAAAAPVQDDSGQFDLPNCAARKVSLVGRFSSSFHPITLLTGSQRVFLPSNYWPCHLSQWHPQNILAYMKFSPTLIRPPYWSMILIVSAMVLPHNFQHQRHPHRQHRPEEGPCQALKEFQQQALQGDSWVPSCHSWGCLLNCPRKLRNTHHCGHYHINIH